MIPGDQSADAAGFAALIRTTGGRPLLLLDALQSLALQKDRCLPVVIVHGGAETFAEVRGICADSAAADRVVVLQAPEAGRRRGYPINVGIEYCLTQHPEAEFVFFLDDDDVVYPFFTSTMAAAFLASGADVVYAASNRREPGQAAAPGYFPRPIHHVLRENFITSNSYAIRAAALRNSRLRMTEELEYTEDWHFLICMLEAGFRFHALPATLSEFRIVSDGNLGGLAQKRDPAMWKAISLKIRRFINTRSFPLPGPELVRMSAPDDISSLKALLAEKEERLTDAATRLREETSQAAHYRNLLGEMEQKFLDADTRLNEKAAEAQHLQNLLGAMERKFLDADTRLNEKASEAQHLRNLLGEMERKFLDANNRLGEKTSEAQHLRNLLDEVEQKFLDANNRLGEKTSEAQHLRNLLDEVEQKFLDANNRLSEKASEAQHLRNLLLEKTSEADILGGQLASEQAAHLLASQELSALKAKLSKMPLRLFVR